MLFAPRINERNPFPILTPTDPTEIGASVLRKMSSDVDTVFHRFPIYSENNIWNRSEKHGRGHYLKHDSVIISQTPTQLQKMRAHNIDKDILIVFEVPDYEVNQV